MQEDLFREPGAAFRGKPFWSWNGELERDELLRQVEVMREMGMGGFFMHSRTGLITRYLGDEWFDLTNDCAAKAQELGLEAWLYDEDRWPSGTAGGLVTHHPEFRARFLRLRVVEGREFLWHDDLLAAWSCDLDDLAFSRAQRLSFDTPSPAYHERKVLAFSIETMDESSFYNGFTYVDTMQRAATDEFIRLTHEAYQARCGEHFGRSIKGIFTDEPHRGPVMAGFGLPNADPLWLAPWTPRLPEEFEKRFGYDLLDHLPDLFLWPEGERVSPVKWHYMELTQQLFLENYARPLFDWCQSNGLLLTGHVLHEDNLTAQATMQGSLMRFYEWMHAPGVDILSEGNRNYWVVKQLSSAARQLGQKWLLSELYGCTGWQMSFESHKAVGDWQALFGINLRCHHLSWYTMEGEAKRDYPASIFFQSAWWKQYSHVETYFARLGWMLSQGEPCCEVLVVNPIESLWCQIHAGWVHGLSPQSEAVGVLEQGYEELFFWLAGAHIDFDYGDEEMMSRLARVERDSSGRAWLRVGEASYRVVVVGRLTTIRSGTLKLLDEFRSAGGEVIFLGEPPAWVDAVASPAAVELAERALALPWKEEPLVAACARTLLNRVEILDPESGKRLGEVFCQLRDDGDHKILVAININTRQSFPAARIRLSGDWNESSVSEWNCSTGERFSVPVTASDGAIEFDTSFPASGERVFVFGPTSEPLAPSETFVETDRQTCQGPFAYSLSEPNVCVLDMARFQIDEAQWQEETEVLKVDQAVRRAFGLPMRSGEMVQPWYREQTEDRPQVVGKVRLRFEFWIEQIPEEPVQLCVERPEWCQIRVNGQTLDSTPRGWWVDNAFKRLAVPLDCLAEGLNVVEWEVDFKQSTNIEALYLVGNFGISLSGTRKTLTALPATLAIGDLTAQGLPFYSGAVTYEIPVARRLDSGEKAFLELGEWEGACARVGEPGHETIIAWQPYRAEVTQAARGSESIALELILTRRNTFGPLHQTTLRDAAYGPGNFVTEGDDFSRNYVLYPAGLLDAPELCFGV